MAVQRKVQTLTEEDGGLRIIWQDGKEDFTTDGELKRLAKEAFEGGVEASVGYEGYYVEGNSRKQWRIKRIELSALGKKPPEASTPPRPEQKIIDERYHPEAMALAFAKDLAVADKIKGNQIIFEAELFNRYLNGDITVPEEVITKLVQQQVKAELKTGTENADKG